MNDSIINDIRILKSFKILISFIILSFIIYYMNDSIMNDSIINDMLYIMLYIQKK